MRGLFITHDASNYGASRSLQLLLRHYHDAVIDLMVQSPFLGRHQESDLRNRFGSHIAQVFQSFLPFDACYQYARRDRSSVLLRSIYNRSIWALSERSVRSRLASGDYDFIHLNSLVLHPIISSRIPFILHMRDVYDGSSPHAVESVQRAAGVIFIDEATRSPFLNVPLRRSIVLNNPIDMNGVKSHADFKPAHPDLDVTQHTIFSIIGVISEQKGTEFIVRTFLRHQDKNARLLVVGGREKSSIDRCRALSRNDRRIIFWGEEHDIDKIYAISDYVLRGDAFPCIGRTVYEGLYAGCRVVVPGRSSAPPPMFEFDRFGDAIYFYHPRSDRDLLALFTQLTGNKVKTRVLRSNILQYLGSFHAFVTDIVRQGR